MISPNYINLDSIIERVRRKFGFNIVERYETAEMIWEIINYLGIVYAYKRKAIRDIVVKNYRFIVPFDFCDFGSAGAIREQSSGLTLTHSTDIFQNINNNVSQSQVTQTIFEGPTVNINSNGTSGESTVFVEISGYKYPTQQLSYDMNDGWFYTGFQSGIVDMIYNAFPISDDGTPQVPDDAKYIRAVVDYIGYMIAFKLTLKGEFNEQLLNRLEKDYYHSAGAAKTHALTPDVAMMESMRRTHQRLVPNYNEFATGFRFLGDQQSLINM